MCWVFKLMLSVSLVIANAWAGDPMAPPGFGFSNDTVPEKAEPEYVVHQIMVHANKKTVVINGEALEEGETINSAVVVRIDREKVVLRVKGQRQILSIAPGYPDVRSQ